MARINLPHNEHLRLLLAQKHALSSLARYKEAKSLCADREEVARKGAVKTGKEDWGMAAFLCRIGWA